MKWIVFNITEEEDFRGLSPQISKYSSEKEGKRENRKRKSCFCEETLWQGWAHFQKEAWWRLLKLLKIQEINSENQKEKVYYQVL